jgi:glycerol uptake facilitator-like aquaporin
MKRSLAEAVGTCVLGFGGCGSAVLAGTRGDFSGCQRPQWCAHITHATPQGREA